MHAGDRPVQPQSATVAHWPAAIEQQAVVLFKSLTFFRDFLRSILRFVQPAWQRGLKPCSSKYQMYLFLFVSWPLWLCPDKPVLIKALSNKFKSTSLTLTRTVNVLFAEWILQCKLLIKAWKASLVPSVFVQHIALAHLAALVNLPCKLLGRQKWLRCHIFIQGV